MFLKDLNIKNAENKNGIKNAIGMNRINEPEKIAAKTSVEVFSF